MKIAIYSRKSKFTGKGESIENQISLCRDYIARIIPEATDSDIYVYEDEGFSAKNLDRPQFRRMMESAKKQPFDYVVVYRLDRISRNVGDFAKLIEELNSMHTAFICIKEQFDTSTPMGRAMMNIAAVFAQLERETIAERIGDNIVYLARTGRWLGGVTPLGYTAEQIQIKDDEGKTRSAYKLTQTPAEVKIVREIYQKYLEFQSITKVRTWLLQHDYKTREGCDFGVSAVRSALRNPVYCPADEAAYEYFNSIGSTVCFDREEANEKNGIMPFFRTNQEGTKNKQTSADEWYIAKGKHKPVVTSDEWLRVQALLAANASKTFYRPGRNEVSLLTGIVRCAQCGSIMRPRVNSNSRSLPDGTRTFSYMCTLKESSRKSRCNMKNISGNLLDKLVCDELRKYRTVDSLVGEQLDKIVGDISQDADDNSVRLSDLKRSLASRKEKIANLIDNLSRSAGSQVLVQYTTQEIERLDAEVKSLEQEIEDLSFLDDVYNERRQQIDEMISRIASFDAAFEDLTFAEKQDYMHSIIEKVEWDGENAHIFLVHADDNR